MLSPSVQTVSWWADNALDFSAPMLRDDTTADVCIVGGGIAGLTAAYLLAREGCSVVLLDARQPTAGETERTTAHLASAIDDRYFNIERWHGAVGARLAAESHTFAIARIERIVREERIDCDFRRVDGYLFCGEGDSVELLHRELEAAHRAGLHDVGFAPGGDATFPGDRARLRFPRQGQFDPLRYSHGLMSAVLQQAGRVYGNSRVVDLVEGTEATVITENGAKVRARSVAVMTNSPINDRVAMHTKMAPYRTYVIAGPVPSGTIPPALFWDTHDPYHYIRTSSGTDGFDMLIVGGEDHKTGQEEHPERAFEALEQWTREHFPLFGRVTHHWSGQVMESIDGLAYIGRNPGSTPNCYIATGDSGMGMTHGTLAGIIISDLVQGRSNPWAELYDPARKNLSAGLTFAKENLNVARQYLDWARPGSSDRGGDLAPGQARLVQRGLHKIALYRDPDGILHQLSAVCPHLGCVVSWNEVENTWDCPCHGSRFEATGDVINGPAMRGLTPVRPQDDLGAEPSDEPGSGSSRPIARRHP